MKKFRLTTNRLIVVGFTFFVLTTLIHFFVSAAMKVIAIFIMSLLLMALLFFQKKRYEEEIEQSQKSISPEESNLEQLLDQMPVGVIKFSPETGELDWINPYANLVCADDDGRLEESLISEFLTHYKDNPSRVWDLHGKKYSVSIDSQLGMLYFYDNLYEDRSEVLVSDKSPAIGIISIDNYDDATENLPDAEVSRLNSLIANFISKFTQQHGIFYRRVDMDRFYLFTDYFVLNQLMLTKFTLLDEFRKEAQELQLPLTLSIGFSFGKENHAEIGRVAQKNLNMALVRGGDQVVVKENDDRKEFSYFGGASVSTVKRSRTRTRAMMTAISDKIKTADKVFVVGHRNLDTDALGATVGMEFFASNLIAESYAVYDDSQMASDIKRAIDSLANDDKSVLITLEEAMSKVTKKSLLIMVDHSKTSLTLSSDFYQMFSEVIVVDHHRRDDDFPENAVLTFIESGASSACELVTELIQFQNAKVKLSKIQASILMAGIMLDTKNFTTRVTSRTFDVGSYLRTLGSDSVEIHQISATDFDEYKAVNALILNSERPWEQVIIARGDEEESYTNVIASKAADTILDMSGIEASFVVTCNIEGNVAISARSRSKINVQRIMEELGGGGHFNLAACQMTDTTISEAVMTLKELIKMEIKEDEN